MRIMTLLAIITILLPMQVRAQDCECEKQTVQEAIESSVAIASGTIVNSKRRIYNSRDRMEVKQQWKGEPRETLVFQSEGACDFRFKEGREYLVFAHGDPSYGYLKVSVCSPTREVQDVSDKTWKALEASQQVHILPVNPPGEAQ